MKLFTSTNRHQPQPLPWARISFFSDLNVPLFSMNKQRPLSIRYIFVLYQDAPIASHPSHHSPDPVLALTDGSQSYAGHFCFLLNTHTLLKQSTQIILQIFRYSFPQSISRLINCHSIAVYCCIVVFLSIYSEKKVKSDNLGYDDDDFPAKG